MWHEYPYTDAHELNLDWFLARFKEYYEHITEQDQKITTMEETVEQFTSFVTNYFDNLDVQQEINNKLDAMAASGELQAMLQPYFDNFVESVNDQITTQNNRINVLNARMDGFSALTEGSTTGDAELQDIRIDAYGNTWATAGDAVRVQVLGVNKMVNPVMTSGAYVSTSTGNLQNLAAASHSDYIELADASDVYTMSSSNLGICFYDVNKVYISGIDGGSASVPGWYNLSTIAPSNAVYIRFSNNHTILADAKVCYKRSTDVRVDKLEPVVSDHSNVIDNDVLQVTTPTMITGYYVSTLTGNLMTLATASYCDYIDLDNITEVYTCSRTNIGICFYDADKNYISGFDGGDVAYADWYSLSSAPANAKYVRFSNYNSILSASDVKIHNTVNDQITRLQNKVNATDIITNGQNFLSMYDHITCIGDSLTWSQVYVSANNQRRAFKTYPQVLSTITGVTTQTNATAGDSPILWWQRSSTGAFDNHGLYIIFLGTNGGLTDTIDTDCVGTNPDTFAETNTGQYGRILQTIANAGDKAVLITPYLVGGGSLETTKTVIEKFMLRYNFPVIDVDVAERTTIEYHYYPDKSGNNMLHFNDLGYAWLANEINMQITALSPQSKFMIMRNQ